MSEQINTLHRIYPAWGFHGNYLLQPSQTGVEILFKACIGINFSFLKSVAKSLDSIVFIRSLAFSGVVFIVTTTSRCFSKVILKAVEMSDFLTGRTLARLDFINSNSSFVTGPTNVISKVTVVWPIVDGISVAVPSVNKFLIISNRRLIFDTLEQFIIQIKLPELNHWVITCWASAATKIFDLGRFSIDSIFTVLASNKRQFTLIFCQLFQQLVNHKVTNFWLGHTKFFGNVQYRRFTISHRKYLEN